MEYLVIFSIYAIIILIGTLWFKTRWEASKNTEEILKRKIDEYGIKISKQCAILENQQFILDDENKKFIYVHKFLFKEPIIKCFEYSKLINFNLFEDGEQQIQGRALISAVGGLAFGATGAIVGSSGGRKIQNECIELSIKIHINDLETPLLSFNLLPCRCNKNDIIHRQAKQKADEIIALLSYIEANK